MFKGGLEKTVVSLLDNGSQVQAPAVAKYVERLRKAHPDESPAQIITRLEKLYLTTVTGSGTAVGAAAAVPGVGTVASVAAISAETAFFLEASAVFTLAVAAVHGVAPEDKERRRALVLAVVLGESGMEIVQKSVGHSAKNWGTLLANKIPGISSMNDSLLKRFLVQFITKRSALMFGKVLPAGIGAAVGGFGNRALGHRLIDNSRQAFGTPPRTWPQPHVIDADPLPALDAADKQAR
ncbi:hypothetical protein IU501_02370 [Nocardia otitidiscaviarum]|uniref:EcsC protein family n=1 Tax=Nocardia otitidiscaviarum TaxID=1823 RepID=A0A378Y8J1_9NOCA|nr:MULTISPECIES: hypothetical protein [Nocardia]MBF6131850.1 hypothetical protein [Nocardia otitidiscaviarum]MBF6178076.1 hypothetical protein [Nocardia otitidiscaviarum]MBF6238511.1 hypothetical protein [Nocardia otitidiscaviarum]MBF6482981.1 hypothetical protein [Nocardia otitidiscaviarum]SUA73053.1 Uncharacterised protein [Nocardia otitidiscaviarum]